MQHLSGTIFGAAVGIGTIFSHLSTGQAAQRFFGSGGSVTNFSRQKSHSLCSQGPRVGSGSVRAVVVVVVVAGVVVAAAKERVMDMNV